MSRDHATTLVLAGAVVIVLTYVVDLVQVALIVGGSYPLGNLGSVAVNRTTTLLTFAGPTLVVGGLVLRALTRFPPSGRDDES